MTEQARHVMLREMLGSHALGHLGPEESDMVLAHLAECSSCRADLEHILPVARLLDAVDPALLDDPPAPPPDLGARIQAEAARERAARDQDEVGARRYGADRRRSVAGPGWIAAAAVVLALLAGGALGGWIGRASAPTAAVVPTEPISLAAPAASDVTVESANLVAHTWGVELRIVATGFAEGRRFRAAFRTEDGRLVPAGEFRGVGAAPMTCFLQSAAMREDVTEVVVTNQRGKTVLTAAL